MDRELLDDLYEIFASTHKVGFLSKVMFNRRMNSKAVNEAVSNIGTFLNNIGTFSYSSRSFKEEQLATIYLRLCESFDEKELQKILRQIQPESNRNSAFLTEEQQKGLREIEASNKKIENLLLGSLGLGDDVDFDFISKDSLIQMLMQPKGMTAEIYEKYKDTIFEMHLSRPVGDKFYSKIEWEDTEHQTQEEYYGLLNSEENTRKLVRRSISEEISSLFSKYTLQELLEDKASIDTDVRIGLSVRLPSLYELNATGLERFYSDNRESLRSVAEHLDEETFERMEHADEYLHQLDALIKSGRFSGDELQMLTEMADCFLHLKLPEVMKSRWKQSEKDKADGEAVIEYILSEAAGDGTENKLSLADRLNEYILNYEFLLRQDIVENVTQIDTSKSQQITLEIPSEKRPVVEINGILIDSIQSFGNPMLHFFNNSRGVQENSFYRYIGTKLIEDEIGKGHRTDEEMRELITDMANLIYSCSSYSELNCSKRGDRYHFEDSTRYKKMLEILGDVDESLIKSYMTQYIESVTNNAQINQLNLGSQIVVDKVNELIDDERIQEQFFSRTEPHISTQILRMRNLEDAKNLPRNSVGLIFDSNGLDPEAIIFSSNRNVETNNHRDLADFEKLEPTERSANLETLRTEKMMSGMVRRDNNELVINRQAVKPSGLVFFGSRKLDENGTKALIKAMETAKKSNLPLVFVDCDAIYQEMETRVDVVKKHDRKQDR